jgi:hypothetical protein
MSAPAAPYSAGSSPKLCHPSVPLVNQDVQSNSVKLGWWLAAFFLTVVGAKFWLIQGYAVPIPFCDEWSEAGMFFKPWVENQLTWHDWIASHNGHRLFFTRLLDVAGLLLNGERDQYFQAGINAVLHTGCFAGVIFTLWVFNGRKDISFLCLLLVPFLALPLAAENTVWDIQSQIYFMQILSLLAMLGLGFGRCGGCWWWLGLAASLLAFFTMASGLLAALSVIGMLGLKRLRGRSLDRGSVTTSLVCLGVFLLGLALNRSAGAGSIGGAHSWVDILATLAWALAWPFENKPSLCSFSCLPVALLLVKYLQGRFKDSRAAEFLLLIAIWGFLLTAAIAYTRTSMVNSSRYADLFCLLPMIGMASLFVLGSEGEWLREFSRGRQVALATGWTLVLFWGLWQTSPRDWQNYDNADNYPLWNVQDRLVHQEKIRAFIATGDSAPMRQYPDYSMITNSLQQPQLSRIMPADCRPPLQLQPDIGTDAAFVPGGCPPDRPPREYSTAWGNYWTNGVVKPGRFVSRPLTARLPRLQLELGCSSDTESIRIELVEQSTGRRTRVFPQRLGRWHEVNVAAPGNPFRLEISVVTPAAWVSVGALRESGWWSYAARTMLGYSVFILLGGLALFASLIGYDLLHHAPGLPRFIRCLALAVVLAAGACIWPERHLDDTQTRCELLANCAKKFAQARQVKEARYFLSEALWLRPDDLQLQAQFRALGSR